MLTLANIHANSKVLVFETCAGLVLGSIMERMGGNIMVWAPRLFFSLQTHSVVFSGPGFGTVIQMFPGEGPVRAGVESFGFPAHFYETLHEFPICHLNALEAGTLNKRPVAGMKLSFWFRC